jgi:NAD(P)-dependent dehydrogenase (short-subunit alcohol dehydrogenase family)
VLKKGAFVPKALIIPKNWSASDIPDLTGKRFLITGATSGIGLAAATQLARRNAHVYITARSVEKARDAIKQIGPGLVDYLLMDLTDLESVRKAAARVDRQFDVVVLNAGVMATPFRKTKDGFELQLGTNHLGHFAFAGLIKDKITDRLVVVSSFAHRMGNFGDNSMPTIKNMMLGIGKYQKWQVYGASKLANLLFVSELERLRIQNNWSFIPIAVHPGYSDTNLQAVASQIRNAKFEEKITKLMNRVIAQPAAAGALPTLAASVFPGLSGASFIGPDGFLEIKGSPKVTRARALAYDQVLAKNLWQVSEELTKVSWS